MTVFAGLDVHKKYFHATAMDKSGDILVQEEFPNETEGYDSLLAMTGEEVKVAFEATYAWEYVYEELEDRVKEVKLAHPKRTEVITKERIKTDVKASEALANLLRTSWLPEAWIPPKETRKLREKLRRRAYLPWKRTGFKNKIKVDLAKHGIRRDFSYSEENKEWLRSLDIDSVADYLDMIVALNNPIERITKEIKKEARVDEDAKLVMTIPGIGPIWSLTITAEIGDVGRFPSPKHFCSYSGLVPSTEQSGSKEVHGSITKEGNKYLRWAAVECAWLHKRHADDTYILRFFKKMAVKKSKQNSSRRHRSENPHSDLPDARKKRKIPPSRLIPQIIASG
ncbi:hypothetical protein AKJ57_00975 [candidate division MSBL1 archaeon SCGC-AAA259A05]|uniref:Uncharacterized protein n=1 Tax=candidate division MSBL1 archaeon SCGC-AAA259A05 TaxID=1698259 RepID=A0A133UBD1_9EURY|nr:hypothetical protein AKJ57_00975 [candidate division MSBL1 archaeon SCGC-AAA259A05]